jgi:hypothetical protein
MKALSLQTGDSVSAVCECQDVASCPFRPSKGRKSQALPHPGPLALQPLRSGCKASTNLMAKNYINIKRELTHREIPVNQYFVESLSLKKEQQYVSRNSQNRNSCHSGVGSSHCGRLLLHSIYAGQHKDYTCEELIQ